MKQHMGELGSPLFDPDMVVSVSKGTNLNNFTVLAKIKLASNTELDGKELLCLTLSVSDEIYIINIHIYRCLNRTAFGEI